MIQFILDVIEVQGGGLSVLACILLLSAASCIAEEWQKSRKPKP